MLIGTRQVDRIGTAQVVSSKASLVNVQITKNALATIVRTIRDSDHTKETGGALFGEELSNTVLHAITPGPRAIHEPAFFSRDLAHTAAESARLYQLDKSQWMGEWHTHPSMNLTPSELDIRTYARHVRDPELAFDSFVALVCSVDDPVRISAWSLLRTDEGLTLRAVGLDVIATPPSGVVPHTQ